MGVVSDQIGDLLTRIRNAQLIKKASCQAPASNMKGKILEILKTEGFIADYKLNDSDAPRTYFEINLKYVKGFPAIQGLKRVSKPGLKIYKKASELKAPINGIGILIVSTSHGVMNDKDCKKKNLGGEVIAEIW